MRRFRVVIIGVAATLPLVLAATAQAGSLVVNSAGDGTPAVDSACTLREAIASSNETGNFPECGAASPSAIDAITFTPGIATIDLGQQLEIISDVQITGPGPGQLEVTNSGAPSADDRIFKVNNAAAATITGLSITGGGIAGTGGVGINGGGIQNSGFLSLERVRVAGNTVAATTGTPGATVVAQGGGIWSEAAASLTLRLVTIENNTVTATNSAGNQNAAVAGGGIDAQGFLDVDRSTIRGNTATATNQDTGDSASARGGGISASATSRVTRSTISGNGATATATTTTTTGQALAVGGGLQLPGGDLELSTVTGNTVLADATSLTTAGVGGGISTSTTQTDIVSSTIADNGATTGATPSPGQNIAYAGVAAPRLDNTIVADPRGAAANCNALVNSSGNNDDYAPTGPSCVNGTIPTDLTVDPLLGPLQGNGGPTETMLPESGSPVIDKGSDNDQQYFGGEQRGAPFVRPADFPAIPNPDNGEDIGAVEIQLPASPPATPTAPAAPAAPAIVPKATCAGAPATITGTEGADRITGTPGPDVIVGLAGKDTINGRGGKDLICGGSGRDTLRGGGGKDRLLGGAGRDTLRGGKGKDKLIGGKGKDKQVQ